MNISTKGIILRDMPLKESDKFITILTPDLGRISVYCNGIRSIKSLFLTSTMPLCYDEFQLFKKGDKFWLKEAAVIESFSELREDIILNSLAQYFAELAYDVTVENDYIGSREILSLILNSLYALSIKKWDKDLIKAVYELRLVSICGMMPDTDVCNICSLDKRDVYLSLSGGVIVCGDCLDKDGIDYQSGNMIHITPAALDAIRYVTSCPAKKIFSFKIPERDFVSFTIAVEGYTLAQLERSFPTLDYYKELLKFDGTANG